MKQSRSPHAAIAGPQQFFIMHRITVTTVSSCVILLLLGDTDWSVYLALSDQTSEVQQPSAAADILVVLRMVLTICIEHQAGHFEHKPVYIIVAHSAGLGKGQGYYVCCPPSWHVLWCMVMQCHWSCVQTACQARLPRLAGTAQRQPP